METDQEQQWRAEAERLRTLPFEQNELLQEEALSLLHEEVPVNDLAKTFGLTPDALEHWWQANRHRPAKSIKERLSNPLMWYWQA